MPGTTKRPDLMTEAGNASTGKIFTVMGNNQIQQVLQVAHRDITIP